MNSFRMKKISESQWGKHESVRHISVSHFPKYCLLISLKGKKRVRKKDLSEFAQTIQGVLGTSWLRIGRLENKSGSCRGSAFKYIRMNEWPGDCDTAQQETASLRQSSLRHMAAVLSMGTAQRGNWQELMSTEKQSFKGSN